MPTCFLNGLCGKQPPKNLKNPIEDPVLAPFVEVAIKDPSAATIAQAAGTANVYGSDSINIRVGNSFPAVVKSLQVGNSSGAGAVVEILDQEGGDFSTIFSKITRLGTVTDALCWVRFGWIATKCDGSTVPASSDTSDPQQQPESGSVTPWMKYLIKGISLDYSAGTIKYTLNCIDLIENLNDTKIPGVIGTTSDPVFFTDAVERVCDELDIEVKFVMFSDATSEQPMRFKGTDSGNFSTDKGLKGVWQGNNRSALECFYEWARPHLADVGPNGKGIEIYWDQTLGSEGGFVFMAQIAPTGSETIRPEQWQVASYVVNGGGCSPVINFKPQIAVTGVVAGTPGGTGGGAVSPGPVPANGPPGIVEPDAAKTGTSQLSPQLYNKDNPLLRVGQNIALSILRNERLGFLRKAVVRGYNSMFMNNLANQPWKAITAELKVQGDPTYSHPLLFKGRTINLIVINPFQVGHFQPCTWENSIQPCNEILSNGSWIIEGVSHDIRDGSFTTTLKIRLATPGFDLALMQPLGGGG